MICESNDFQAFFDSKRMYFKGLLCIIQNIQITFASGHVKHITGIHIAYQYDKRNVLQSTHIIIV